jgi:hypothetical protein
MNPSLLNRTQYRDCLNLPIQNKKYKVTALYVNMLASLKQNITEIFLVRGPVQCPPYRDVMYYYSDKKNLIR